MFAQQQDVKTFPVVFPCALKRFKIASFKQTCGKQYLRDWKKEIK